MKIRAIKLALIVTIIESLILTPVIHAAPKVSTQDHAPQVSHDPITKKLKEGSSQQIKALVIDDAGISSVTLFYRKKGEKQYQNMAMRRMGTSNYYAATLGNKVVEAPGVEYYIEAMDSDGNGLFHGYAYQPLSIEVEAAVARAPRNDPEIEELNADGGMQSGGAIGQPKIAKEEESSNTWMWMLLGAVVIGAAASSGGGGGGGGEKPEPEPTGASLTVTSPVVGE